MAASNAIGNFQIGVSPIGTLPPFDYHETLISQYANSPILLKLIDNFSQYIDQTANLDAFYDTLFNISTAQGAGLDVWGRIVGVQRIIVTPAELTFGFQEAGVTSSVGFGQGAFYSSGSLSSSIALSDSAFRLLILAKALANITDGSITSINQLMMSLFPGRGACYVVDGGNMTLTYVFAFPTTAVEKAVIQGSGVLPKPTGVFANYSFA